jgi:hypothetical protein
VVTPLYADALPGLTNAVLSGERNLEVGGKVLKSGALLLTTSMAVNWTRDRLPFANGQIEPLSTKIIARGRDQGLATNQLVFP